MNPSLSQESFWHGRPVLVTGCNGFVGSWLSAALVEQGARVIGLFRTNNPESELVRSGLINQITAVYGELADYALLEQTLAEYEIDTVFHLAGQTIVGVAYRSPLSTFETNVRGTWLLLEAIRHTSTVRGVVVASSEKAYGEPVALPYHESHPLQAHFPYAVSKSCADLIAQSYAFTYKLPIAITRCSNLYGGGDLNWDRLLPGTIRSVLAGESPVIRSDGSFKRDYLYVADAVQAYLTIAEQAADPDVCGRPFNFGIGMPLTALEVVETVISVSDRPSLRPIILDEVTHEIQDEYLSTQRAQEVLGWQPRYSLEQGISETMAWYRDYLALP